MSTQVLKVDHINLTVRNLEESLQWYGRIFGFVKVEGGTGASGGPWAIVRKDDLMLCMYEAPHRRFVDGDQLTKEKIHGVYHFGIRITDKNAWEKTLSDNAIESYRWQYPHSYSWYINDPTGYEIEVAHWDNDVVSFQRVS
jgi:catechol 2,3-dioxygenase-like lactoylglutathione lyase family enzyme